MADVPDGFVLDCSVAMAWCFDDEATSYTDVVRDRLSASRAVVPSPWPLEVANVALIGERRKRLDRAKTAAFFALLDRLPIIVDDQGAGNAFVEVIQLARTYQLSAYDAAYLELAIRRGIPPATLDAKLGAAALAAGVSPFER